MIELDGTEDAHENPPEQPNVWTDGAGYPGGAASCRAEVAEPAVVNAAADSGRCATARVVPQAAPASAVALLLAPSSRRVRNHFYSKFWSWGSGM